MIISTYQTNSVSRSNKSEEEDAGDVADFITPISKTLRFPKEFIEDIGYLPTIEKTIVIY